MNQFHIVVLVFFPRGIMMTACGVGLVYQAKREEEEVASLHALSLSFSRGVRICCKKIFFNQPFEPRRAR